MKVKGLIKDYVKDFLDYCKVYGKDHDASYLYDLDMKDQDFTNTNANPTYILLDEDNKIVGVVSLMLDINFGKGIKKYRFRIFHTIDKKEESYKMLFKALLKDLNNVDELFMFIPLDLHKGYMSNILQALGLEVERFSFVMERDAIDYNEPEFLENYGVRPLDINQELDIWCNIRNESFKTLTGTATCNSEGLRKYINSNNYIQDGIMLLFINDKPIGTLFVGRDEDDQIDEAGIETIGILQEYQGKGLGRQLLRTGIKFAIENGYEKLWLSVHGENEKATKLYKSEGFKLIKEVVCYKWNNI